MRTGAAPREGLRECVDTGGCGGTCLDALRVRGAEPLQLRRGIVTGWPRRGAARGASLEPGSKNAAVAVTTSPMLLATGSRSRWR